MDWTWCEYYPPSIPVISVPAGHDDDLLKSPRYRAPIMRRQRPSPGDAVIKPSKPHATYYGQVDRFFEAIARREGVTNEQIVTSRQSEHAGSEPINSV